jgi:transcriptional regulator with XRE-family HTH domain
VRSNLAGPFVASLLSRSKRSRRWAAEEVGVSHSAVDERLRGVVSALSLEKLAAVAAAAGATEGELETVANLHAIDRGALPLDEQTTLEEVQAARAAIEARRC